MPALAARQPFIAPSTFVANPEVDARSAVDAALRLEKTSPADLRATSA
jgi:hypothetical protein